MWDIEELTFLKVQMLKKYKEYIQNSTFQNQLWNGCKYKWSFNFPPFKIITNKEIKKIFDIVSF